MGEPRPTRRHRIAVILPAENSGHTWRGAVLLARALWLGSRQMGEEAEVVLAYLQDREMPEDILPPAVARRAIEWQEVKPDEAHRAMRYAGYAGAVPATGTFLTPNDGAQHLCDCDLWILASDALPQPLIPVRPYVLMLYDAVQRTRGGQSVARGAERVLVASAFCDQDARVYARVAPEKIVRVPVLTPDAPAEQPPGAPPPAYFLWAAGRTADAPALSALRTYYQELNGSLECRATGVAGTLADRIGADEALAPRLRLLGPQSGSAYREQLASAAFLWHPTHVDHASLSVFEAAQCSVPTLARRYAALEELDARHGLQITWMDCCQPQDSARRLKWMEEHAGSVRAHLAENHQLAAHGVEHAAREYWRVVRKCL